MKRNIILLILFLCSTSVFSQKEKKLVQFSGVILSADTLDAIPFVNIFDKTIRRATFGDYTGFFSMVVQAGDTIMFQSTGYKKLAEGQTVQFDSEKGPKGMQATLVKPVE